MRIDDFDIEALNLGIERDDLPSSSALFGTSGSGMGNGSGEEWVDGESNGDGVPGGLD